MYNQTMNSESCLQLNNEFGMTPCFCMAGKTPCSLNFCPAKVWLDRNPQQTANEALHRYCVMSITYDEQNEFQEGKGEFAKRMKFI